MNRTAIFLLTLSGAVFGIGCVCNRGAIVDRGDAYVPSEMEWVVTKLQANARVPWHETPFAYSIDYERGTNVGEVVARVVYEAPASTNGDFNMMGEIAHRLGEGGNILAVADLGSPSDLRYKMHLHVLLVTGGRRIAYIDELGEVWQP